jgi:hypothetical protein
MNTKLKDAILIYPIKRSTKRNSVYINERGE